jgi:hypothetical protein
LWDAVTTGQTVSIILSTNALQEILGAQTARKMRLTHALRTVHNIPPTKHDAWGNPMAWEVRMTPACQHILGVVRGCRVESAGPLSPCRNACLAQSRDLSLYMCARTAEVNWRPYTGRGRR